MRVGTGFDVHRFRADRKLWLGGVLIREENGLEGHSDADVLIHAVIDALLGAAGLGNIGEHFPDTEAAFEGVSSLFLLEKTAEMLRGKEFEIVNIDITLICEEPKVSSFKQKAVSNLAKALGCGPEDVSLKGKTTEGLGFTGRGEGIACQAAALIRKRSKG